MEACHAWLATTGCTSHGNTESPRQHGTRAVESKNHACARGLRTAPTCLQIRPFSPCKIILAVFKAIGLGLSLVEEGTNVERIGNNLKAKLDKIKQRFDRCV